MEMRVEFYKANEGRLCGWVARPPKRRPFIGTTMAAGRDLPHDLAQFVVELAIGAREGFWGLLSHGATFKSVPGRRLTQPGRDLVRTHFDALNTIEMIANTHIGAWRRGEDSIVRPALDAMYARWMALGPSERLAVTWPVRPLSQDSVRAGRRQRRDRPKRMAPS